MVLYISEVQPVGGHLNLSRVFTWSWSDSHVLLAQEEGSETVLYLEKAASLESTYWGFSFNTETNSRSLYKGMLEVHHIYSHPLMWFITPWEWWSSWRFRYCFCCCVVLCNLLQLVSVCFWPLFS